MYQNIGKYLIFIGIILLLAGILVYAGGDKLKWFGHLPGDIRVEKTNFRFYFPLTTMIILSLLITLIINVIRKIL
jgi:hypothetical protein